MRQERIQRRPQSTRRSRRDVEVAAPAGAGDTADSSLLAATDELLTRIAAALREQPPAPAC